MMIRFTLKCAEGHDFESWFQSSDAFEKLHASNMVSCAVCGSSDVQKSLMAPRVRPAREAAPKLGTPAGPEEKALDKMRRHVEENSEYVGMSFASEARKMHEGETPERAIYGEAKAADAKKLIEDGVPVAPLPFLPKRKAN